MSTSTLLDKLNEINESTTHSISVPTAKKEFEFRGLNVNQQKEIIKTAADGPSSGITLTNVLNEIIVSNASADYNFSIIDRYPIILALRSLFVDDVIKVAGNKLSIAKHLATVTTNYNSLLDGLVLKDSIVVDGITVHIEVPSLNRDIKVNKAIERVNEVNTSIGDTIGNLYIYEIEKFIQSIEFGDDTYNFADGMSASAKRSIIEAMPSSINKDIIDFITKTRKIENYYLDTEFGSIEIDAAFFTSE